MMTIKNSVQLVALVIVAVIAIGAAAETKKVTVVLCSLLIAAGGLIYFIADIYERTKLKKSSCENKTDEHR
jgi:hypothetical protein